MFYYMRIQYGYANATIVPNLDYNIIYGYIYMNPRSRYNNRCTDLVLLYIYTEFQYNLVSTYLRVDRLVRSDIISYHNIIY